MFKYLSILLIIFVSLNANIAINKEVITQKDLELLKCNLLSECLEFSTSISSLSTQNDIFQTTVIRSNASTNNNSGTLLLIDGIPILNSFNNSFNLDSIPLSSISKIEITKGSSSIAHGDNAINGTINIITKSAEDKNIIRTRFGSYETFLASTSLSYQLDSDLSLSLFAEHAKSSGEPLMITDELQNSQLFEHSYKNSSFIGKLIYKDFWIHTQVFERRLPNYNTIAFIDNGTDLKNQNDESQYTFGIGYKQNINDDIFLKFQSSYNKWNLRKEIIDNSSYLDYDSYSFYNELETHFFTNSNNPNIFGVSYEITNAHRFLSQNNSYDIGSNDKKTYNISLYDDGEYLLNEKLNLLYLCRYFNSSYYDKLLDKNIADDSLSFGIGFSYKLSQNSFVKTLYSQAYNQPTKYEKEVDTSSLISNTNLSPELSKTFDLVLSNKLKSFDYSLGLFYTKIEDKISTVDINSSLQNFENLKALDYYGAEINTKFSFSETFYGFANYSYYQFDKKNNLNISNFTYNQMFNFAISKLFANEYLINTSIKYLDDWGNASSYTLVNFSFDYNPKSMKNISYEMIMKNILDEKIDLPEIARNNENVKTIPFMYESRIYLGLKYDF